MGDVEKVGLLKMDFLGLRNAHMPEVACQARREAGSRRNRFDLQNLPLDDVPRPTSCSKEAMRRASSSSNRTGIRELLVQDEARQLRDLIAILALYRPGPLDGGMVDATSTASMAAKQPTYEHPVMEDVLEETYGMIVYQEQVMRS